MENVTVSVHFARAAGTIKPMHGIGQPPATGLDNTMFHYLTEAGIPYARLHDVGGWLGHGLYVDIPNLFRDFDADEQDPASYDFAFTDRIVQGLVQAGCQPYFRLGVTIENAFRVKAYRIFPPKDFAKWARICEHVIRHYNEGWANGFCFGIRYWEIWNEPENPPMWQGTPEQYFALYEVTAKHLKACFGETIRVGGYGHCGLYEYEKDPDLVGYAYDKGYIYDAVMAFMHGFFTHQRQAQAPMDFFSFHVYDNCHDSVREDFTRIREHAVYARRMLDHYGYTETECHLNEWNLFTDARHRDAPVAAAKSLSFMLMMQNTPVDVMCFYDGGLGYGDYRGLFNPDTGYPYRNYYAFAMFNSLYRLKNQVFAESSSGKVFVGAARDGRRGAVVLANPTGEAAAISLDVRDFAVSEMQVHRIDEENRYTLTGETPRGQVYLPPASCLELRLWDLH